MVYGVFRGLNRRIIAGKVLHEVLHHILYLGCAQDTKYDGYQSRLASMVYEFYDKKTASFVLKPTSDGTVKS